MFKRRRKTTILLLLHFYKKLNKLIKLVIFVLYIYICIEISNKHGKLYVCV